jgi:hypothetical protein
MEIPTYERFYLKCGFLYLLLQQIFLFTTASRPVLEPTQPPIQWVPGSLSLGVKRPGRVSVEALRRADSPAKESYEMSLYVDREAH